MNSFGFVLLAAGSSTRMGSPKQLLPFDGRPLIRHAAETALASDCSPVIVVLGANASLIRPALDGLAVHVVVNPWWEDGISSSIHAGIERADSLRLDGVIVALADQPFIHYGIYNQMLESHVESRQPIVAARHSGTIGLPAFFAREFFPRLFALRVDQGCKSVILSNSLKTFRLDVPEAAIDINTPNDFLSLQPEPAREIA